VLRRAFSNPETNQLLRTGPPASSLIEAPATIEMMPLAGTFFCYPAQAQVPGQELRRWDHNERRDNRNWRNCWGCL